MTATGSGVLRRLVRTLLPLSLLLLPGVGVAQGATVPQEFYGVNMGSGLMDDVAARPAAFAAMRAGGLSSVRIDASWSGVEPVAPIDGVHTYRWAQYDSLVGDLARHGLRWYPMVGYSAGWASTTKDDPFAPPAGDEHFAAFAAALASRYGPRGAFWAEHPDLPRLPPLVYGIWNEPSNSMFWRGPDATPERYMRLYVAARAAIRAVEPEAVVATGGILDSGGVDGQRYLRAMLAGVPQPQRLVDAVGWHPYVGAVDEILLSVARARETMDALGMQATPIEVSEVGWIGGLFTPADRAQAVRTLAARLPRAGLGVSRLLPYVWSGAADWQLADPDGSPGPGGAAYFAGIQDALSAPETKPRTEPQSKSSAATPRLNAWTTPRMRLATARRRGLAVRCRLRRAGRCRVVVMSRGRTLARASVVLRAGVVGRLTAKLTRTALRRIEGRRPSVRLLVSAPGAAPVALAVRLHR